MSIVTAIIIGVIILAIIVILFVDTQKAERQAIEDFRSLGLEELQKPNRVPQLSHISLMPSFSEIKETVFKLNATIWFEALLAETFARPRDFPSDYSFLTSQYVRFLTNLRDFLSKQWPDVFVNTRDSEDAVILEGGKAWHSSVLHNSLEWLGKIATEHNRLSEHCEASCVTWETALFESSFVAGTPSDMLSSYGAIKFRLTPAALKGEIERLSALSVKAESPG